jgi:DNA (cytosine-5)-methyltransferase 1
MTEPMHESQQLPAFEIGTRIRHHGLLATIADPTGHQQWEGWLYIRYDKYPKGGAWAKMGTFEVVSELKNQTEQALMRANFDFDAKKDAAHSPKRSASKNRLAGQIRKNLNPPAETADIAAVLRKWTQTSEQKAAIRAKWAELPKGSVLNLDRGVWEATHKDRLPVDTRKFRELSLFAGIGGFTWGLGMTGHYEPVAFVEIDPFCQKVLAKNFPNVPIFGDVKNVTIDVLRELGHIDVITAGFPCQDISVAGKGEGIKEGNRSGLWFEAARIIGDIRPRYVILENVPAITIRGGNLVTAMLAEMGYDCQWGTLRAADFGAAHQRERWFCVAYASGSRYSGSPIAENLSRVGQWYIETDFREGRDNRESDQVIATGEILGNTEGGTHRRNSRAMAETSHETGQQNDGGEFGSSSETMEYARRAGRQECDITSKSSSTGYSDRRSDGSGRKAIFEPVVGRDVDGLSSGLDGYRLIPVAPPGVDQYEHEPPRTTGKLPNRANRVKALGNAVVPQCIAYIGECLWRFHEQRNTRPAEIEAGERSGLVAGG